MEDSTPATICSESHSEEQVLAIIAKRPRSRCKMTHPEANRYSLDRSQRAVKSQRIRRYSLDRSRRAEKKPTISRYYLDHS